LLTAVALIHPARRPCWPVALAAALLAAAGTVLLTPAAQAQPARSARAGTGGTEALKVIQLPIRTDGPKSLDPVEGSTTYDNMACSQVYETLLDFKYTNVNEMQPLLLEAMPTSEDGGKTWNFKLKKGVRFHDNPCFPGGKGRELVTDDVFYSLKRIFDPRFGLKNEWLLAGTIEGMDDYAKAQQDAVKAGGTYDYNAPVSGFVKSSDHEFQIVLTKPVYRFLYVLTMFQTSVVPHEAVKHFGTRFASNPVGTGPFMFESWTPKDRYIVVRNPNYREETYPAASEWSSDDRRLRLHRAAGQKLPIADRLEFTMFVQDQPMWLQFRAGNLGYTEVPAEYFEEAYDKRTRQLLPDFQRRGIQSHANLLLDMIFRGFNMEDELLGGYTSEKKALRQAIHLAIDQEEFNQVFYNGINIIYDGPIPPGLEGHPENGRAPKSWRGPNLELARQKLAEAGYPDGRGLPPIKFYTSRGGNNAEQVELLRRQLAAVNIRLDPQLVDFSELIRIVNDRQAPMFGFAWGSDYPDAENNLALFYTPNASPGSNHYNYSNPEYDALYEQILVMEPGPERTAIYEKMRDMIIDDCAYVGSMARTRFYLVAPWMLNAKPTERFYSWYKYLDVDNSRR
jgi:oligopeptide transport system substrate-binding protein